MQKNFTHLIAHYLSSKRYTVPAGVLLFVLATSLYVWADIIAITPQTVEVSADKAVGGPSASFTELAPIVIRESDQKDFFSPSNGTATGTFTLTAPTGWAFRPTGVNAIARTSTGGTDSNVSINGVTYNSTTTPTTITIAYSVTAQNRLDVVTISGVALQAQIGAVMSARQVTMTREGTATLAGFTSPTTVANISQTFGVASKVGFTTEPVGANIYANLSSQPVVAVQDWFGNTVTNATNIISLAIGTNPATPNKGSLGGGPASINAVNGIATFSGLNIDASGSGYTLVASSGSLATATSTSFSITSATLTLNEIASDVCLVEGAGAYTLTVTGTRFDRNAVGRIEGADRPTTYISSSELKIALTAADLATAGTKKITVLNPGPPTNFESGARSLVVNPSLAKAVFTQSQQVICSGNSVTFAGPSTGFTNYGWTIPNGGATVSTESGNSATIRFNLTPPSTGEVTLAVAATNACGTRETRSIVVKVNQTPPAVVTPESALSFCDGGFVNLKASEAPEGQQAYLYQWFKNGSSINGASNSVYKAEDSGNYSVTVTASEVLLHKEPWAVTVTE